MANESETVIGAKSAATGLWECWAAKDGDYDVEAWKNEMASYGYTLHEMHVSDMLDIIDAQRGKVALSDA